MRDAARACVSAYPKQTDDADAAMQQAKGAVQELFAIAERMAAWRRERRVLLRVPRAAWRLEQAERERSWALAPAGAGGV